MAEIVHDRVQLSKRIQEFRAQGKKVVLANGLFDLLRVGHSRYLKAAKVLGDVLVLALPNDDSVKKSHGPGRPLLPLEDRMGVLAAFGTVDLVVSYPEEMVDTLLAELKPDLFASQGPTRIKGEAFGGKVVELKETGDLEAEELIREILRKYSDPNTKINE